MTGVAIVGTGVIRFSKDGRDPVGDLLAAASRRAIGSARGLEGAGVGAVMVSTNDASGYLGPVLAESVGARPGAAQKVESLCSSGANALVSGYAHIRAGLADTVLVAGADVFDGPGRVFERDDSRGADRRPVAWASMFAAAYGQKYGVTGEQIAGIAARAHQNAQANEYAYPHPAHTASDVAASRTVAPSLRLLECSRACTGAAAVVLASEGAAPALCETPAWITGVGQSTLGARMSSNPSLWRLDSAARAASDALAMAGVAASDVDVAELHDAFAVCEPMALEAVGMARPGLGAKALCEMASTGQRRANPRGGILGSGHALGATGIAQTAEVARQVAGTAGPTQVDSADTGLVHNMAAAATSSTVIVLRPEP